MHLGISWQTIWHELCLQLLQRLWHTVLSPCHRALPLTPIDKGTDMSSALQLVRQPCGRKKLTWKLLQLEAQLPNSGQPRLLGHCRPVTLSCSGGRQNHSRHASVPPWLTIPTSLSAWLLPCCCSSSGHAST